MRAPMSTQRIATVVADRRDDWSGHDSRVPVTQAQSIALPIARSTLTRVADPTTAAYGQRSDPDLLRSLGLTSPMGTLNNAGALLFTDDLNRGEQLVYIHRRTLSGALVVNEHLSGPLLPILERAGAPRRTVGPNLDQPPWRSAAPDRRPPGCRGPRGDRQRHHASRLPPRRPGADRARRNAPHRRLPGPFVTGVTAQNVLTTSSRPRNSVLARAIRTLGLAEAAGSGVDRMYVRSKTATLRSRSNSTIRSAIERSSTHGRSAGSTFRDGSDRMPTASDKARPFIVGRVPDAPDVDPHRGQSTS